MARSWEGGQGRTGSEARASGAPGRDAEGKICRDRKQAAIAALTAPVRSDRTPCLADSLGAPLPSSGTESKSLLDRESRHSWAQPLIQGPCSFCQHPPPASQRCLPPAPRGHHAHQSPLSLSHGNPSWWDGQLGILLRHCGKGFPSHLPSAWQQVRAAGFSRPLGGGWRLEGKKATLSPTTTHWHQLLPHIIWRRAMGVRRWPGPAQAGSIPTGSMGKLWEG